MAVTQTAAPLRGTTAASPHWSRSYARALAISDCLAIYLAVATALVLRFGNLPAQDFAGLSYAALALALGPAWLGSLYLSGAYDLRFLGVGQTEFRAVLVASGRFFGAVAVAAYVFQAPLARGFVAIAFPLGTALLLGGRYLGRKVLHGRRSRGEWCHRMLVVGDARQIEELARVIQRETYAGFQVVGACLAGGDRGTLTTVPVVGSLTTVRKNAEELAVDAIAVTASPGVTPAALRRLAWELEGSGIALVIVPGLTDVAGPRISVRPVAGLPLLHLEEPDFTGPKRLAKDVQDRTLAGVALVLAAPLLLALTVAIKLDSPGPVVFTQRRVGQGGREFRVFKFRSMVVDAEQRLAELRHLNEADPAGLLFKLAVDPRVTKVGRFMRAWSLDELPQLINVIRGDMALVGPRPPLPSEVARYGGDIRRRLLVRPGITGLWQVSGRSNLSWEDTVRLDLYYVENWSLALDALILWKTAAAVLHRRGAY